MATGIGGPCVARANTNTVAAGSNLLAKAGAMRHCATNSSR